MELLGEIAQTLLGTVFAVLPIAAIVIVFQLFVIRRPLPHLRQLFIGFVYVVLGLSLFLLGLEKALFPFGRLMAKQLTDPAFIATVTGHTGALHWTDYYWVYVFAITLGFSTTIAEPALMAVAFKANQVSGGTIDPWGLRITVAIGVALGIGLGVLRIITGMPIHWFIIAGYSIVILQTPFAPRVIVPLAYDCGGVSTSTVTVPLVTALGLGLAETVPGRHPLIDGFGLIAFAVMCPIISVMAYAQLSVYRARRAARHHRKREALPERESQDRTAD